MSIHNRTHPLTPMASAGSFLCFQLYEGNRSIVGLGLNGLQLALLIISCLFLAFLLLRLPSSIRKLRENSTPLRTLYYCILWVRERSSEVSFCFLRGCRAACNSWLRRPLNIFSPLRPNSMSLLHKRLSFSIFIPTICFLFDSFVVGSLTLLLSWLLWKNIDAGGEILWIVTGSIIFAVEVSIVVFLFSPADHPRTVTRRVVIVTLILAATFAAVQGILMFVGGVKIYDYTKSSMWYWTPLNLVKLAIYVVILSLPCINCSMVLPRKRSFYVYATLLVAMHLLNLIGNSLVFADEIEVGFCFIDSSVILYYTLFPPVLYFSFLWEFFHRKEESRPLFDEIEYEQIN